MNRRTPSPKKQINRKFRNEVTADDEQEIVGLSFFVSIKIVQ